MIKGSWVILVLILTVGIDTKCLGYGLLMFTNFGHTKVSEGDQTVHSGVVRLWVAHPSHPDFFVQESETEIIKEGIFHKGIHTISWISIHVEVFVYVEVETPSGNLLSNRIKYRLFHGHDFLYGDPPPVSLGSLITSFRKIKPDEVNPVRDFHLPSNPIISPRLQFQGIKSGSWIIKWDGIPAWNYRIWEADSPDKDWVEMMEPQLRFLDGEVWLWLGESYKNKKSKFFHIKAE